MQIKGRLPVQYGQEKQQKRVNPKVGETDLTIVYFDDKGDQRHYINVTKVSAFTSECAQMLYKDG